MIRVNEKWDVLWHEGMTIQDVLEACQFTHHHIVVSVNDSLVPSDQHAVRLVQDGDRVRVIHVIGGG